MEKIGYTDVDEANTRINNIRKLQTPLGWKDKGKRSVTRAYGSRALDGN